MAQPENSMTGADINRTAATYFATMESGEMTPEDETELSIWLAQDRRHAMAFDRAATIWSSLDAMTLRSSVSPMAQRPGRRRWVPAALAASIAVAAFFGTDMPTRLRADAMTGTGEIRQVRLPDGSLATLNTRSAIAYDRDGRSVTLLKGEAAFKVAGAPGHPFVVTARDGSTTALGTRFLVDSFSLDTRVVVTEHSVRVAFDGKTVIVGQGQAIGYGMDGLGQLSSVSTAEAEAWTRGRIRVVNKPLGEVVEQLGRYRIGVIRVMGTELARRPVSGSFDIHDPVGAIDVIEQTLGVHSIRLTDRMILLHD